ncbi:hypothetical protein [Pseudaminobacter sp. NGMCC 1.201702]|uniref:hypothetical protein n=1 Tax=Pseudaminobacter sp. NGMCC 1.201702 TaxID=3391825 RepID=UPI0039EF23DC
MRLPLMAFEPRSANSWGLETVRAISEKNVALAEGVTAAQLSLLQSATGFWFDIWMGRAPGLLNSVAIERSMRAALKPAGLRVKANYRRLSRKK